MKSQEISTESRTLSGAEKIWYATLTLNETFGEDTDEKTPEDGLMKLLTNPWDALGKDADLPTNQPVTMLFLSPREDGGEFNSELIAEGITGTTFITVREAEPLSSAMDSMAMGIATEQETETPAFYRNIKPSAQPMEVVTMGRLAYAHYHLSEDETKRMQFRYAICRAPKYMVRFLNRKAEESDMKTRFSVVDDGTFRVVYQTDGAKPDVAILNDDPPQGRPCIKLTGTMTDDDFRIDSMMMVPYRAIPTP